MCEESDVTTKITKVTKERPILYGGEMIRAILARQKTHTRRIIKPQPPLGEWGISKWETSAFQAGEKFNFLEISKEYKCPFGNPGDRLWARETFVLEKYFWQTIGDEEILHLPTDRPYDHHPAIYDDDEYWLIPHYRATDPTPDLVYEDAEEPTCRWRPSIFMPRWASRINQLITSVRVERVQDITEEDAVKEGFICEYPETARDRFLSYFYAKSKNLVDQNPLVWVIETELEEPNYG